MLTHCSVHLVISLQLLLRSLLLLLFLFPLLLNH